MQKILKTLIFMTISPFILYANSYTYSYFGIGVESFTYKENGKFENNPQLKGRKFNSSVKATTPVYQTGTILNLKDYIISLDFSTTLVPSSAIEDWNVEGYGIVKRNSAEMTSNSIRILYHHFLGKKARVVSGVNYILNTVKRYGLEVDLDKIGQTYEETSSTLIFDIGYWYESKKASQEGFRYVFNAIYGYPIYQDTTNTNYPNKSFSSNGYNFDASIYGGYTIRKGIEVGLFLSYNYMKRDEDREVFDANHDLVWPENKSSIIRYGIRTIWNFN